ncbi:hypothetical protein RB653_006116 [Dictyostelium firmibasis]|uniref:Uncharacterized protein n=1 Tax=Dictyostelium firmibasis TaxID=79012 RepID=A0AAN7U289_9MYCE
MGFYESFRSVYNFNSIKVKVSLVEALAVSISSIVAILPWKDWGVAWGDGTLIYTPIMCLMVTNNVSSFTNIHLSITMLIGTLVAVLYCYLILLITREIVWITFIPTFFFYFIITAICNIPNRKWMTGLFLKVCFLYLFMTLYFTKVENINNDIAEDIYSMLFVVGTVVIASLVFPTLASRLVFGKVVKTMNSTRNYFLLIGNLFEDKLGKGGTMKTPAFNKTFERMENQLIKEQQEKQNHSGNGIIEKPILNVSVKSSSSSSIQEIPMNVYGIGVTPLLNSQNQLDQYEINEEKLKLPLSRSMKNNNNSVVILDIGKHRSKSLTVINHDNTKDTSNRSRSKSVLSTPNLKEKIEIIKNQNLNPLEEDMQILEIEISNRIATMTTLLSESKGERWNDDLNDNYDKLISMFEMTLKQLISIKSSIKGGFSQISNDELIQPLIPFIQCLIEEVYLQMGIMIDILKNQEFNINDHESVFKLLSKSFDETQELVDRVKGAFKYVVKEYQESSSQLLSNDDVTKVHFFVHGILSFSLQQRQFADILIKVKKQQHLYSVRWELIRYGLLMVLTGFPLMIFKRFKFIKNKLFGCGSSSSKTVTKEKKNENIFISVFKWIYFHFFKDNKWRFPLQMSIALITSTIPFFFVGDGVTDSSGTFITFGLWTVTTIVFIIGPSVGASITQGFRESRGTLGGAIVGFLVSLLCSVIPTPYKEIVIIVFIFIFTFCISYPHQNKIHGQSAEICALTFLLVLLGQNLTHDFDYMFAVLRTVHIIFGVVWNAIVCLIVFPYFTYKDTRIKIFKITNNLSDTFINIIVNGLRMNEQINGNGSFNNFNNNLIDHSDFIKRHQDIKNILINYDNNNNNINNNNNNNNSQNKSNHFDNINNIIKLQIGTIESVKSLRDKMKQEIYESLKEIRISIDDIKDSLSSVESELYFVSPSKTIKYYSLAENLISCSTRLVALENSFDPIFTDLIILSMFDLNKPLNDLFQQLIKSKADIKLLLAGKFKSSSSSNDIFQHCQLINEKWNIVQQEFKSLRSFLLNEKLFHILHPYQIQFGSGIHSIELFIQSFVLLFEDLRSIKDETSYLKQFLKLK